MGVVTVCHNSGGRHLGKLVERLLNILQILEIIQMVRLHIQHHSQSGVEVQEGIAVFTAFQHNRVPMANPVSGVEQGQISADHDRGIRTGFHQDVGHHGGGSGFPVGAGNADRVFVGPHDLPPGLGPLKNGNARGSGGGDLRIIIMGSGSADHALGPLYIIRAVADGNRDTLGLQLLRGKGTAHIGAGDHHAHPFQYQTQRPHGHAADTDQMNPAARLQIGADLLILRHTPYSPDKLEVYRKLVYYTSFLKNLQLGNGDTAGYFDKISTFPNSPQLVYGVFFHSVRKT